jgi:predicted AAA+ superfamily ATPase
MIQCRSTGNQVTAEVDFIVQHGADTIPVEVKSERNNKSKSLAGNRAINILISEGL